MATLTVMRAWFIVVHRVGLQEVAFSDHERRAFEIVDESGRTRKIPFHRVREVIKDGQIIWSRPP